VAIRPGGLFRPPECQLADAFDRPLDTDHVNEHRACAKKVTVRDSVLDREREALRPSNCFTRCA
jgi:hypothetical protein